MRPIIVVKDANGKITFTEDELVKRCLVLSKSASTLLDLMFPFDSGTPQEHRKGVDRWASGIIHGITPTGF